MDNHHQDVAAGRKFHLSRTVVNELGALTGLVLICLIISLLTPRFLILSNLINILVQISVIATIAVGMTFVILTGGIDLSVGSNVALGGLVLGILMIELNVPVWAAVMLTLLMGTVIGYLNGVLITRLVLPPFIVTLGTMSIVRGAAYSITGGQPVYTFPESFLMIAQGSVFSIPIPIIIIAAIYGIAYYLLKFTKLGRYSYSIGGNEYASILSGIKVKSYKTAVYAITGFLCAISSALLTARLDSAVPVAGDGYELDAIAAVVIGGTSMMGGEGKITGTLIGALIMGVVSNGLNLLTVPSGNQRMIKGGIIIIAVLIDVLRKRKSA